jgi:hypothetical protein
MRIERVGGPGRSNCMVPPFCRAIQHACVDAHDQTYGYPGEVLGSRILKRNEVPPHTPSKTFTALLWQWQRCCMQSCASSILGSALQGQLGLGRVRRRGKTRAGRKYRLLSETGFCALLGLWFWGSDHDKCQFRCSVQHIDTSSQELDSPLFSRHHTSGI